MPNLFKKALVLLTGTDNLAAAGLTMSTILPRAPKRLTERELIQRESEIGAQLFGPIPPGHHRKFFNLDETTWIWYEEWIDPETRKKKTTTTRYEVHTNGILKVQEGARYNFLEGREFDNLVTATQLYYERVMHHVYRRDPQTGRKLRPGPTHPTHAL